MLPQTLRDCADFLRNARPSEVLRRRDIARSRKIALEALHNWSQRTKPGAFKNVLVDGQWENPNYWVRYAILRKALSLGKAVETGILGPWQRKAVNAAFDQLGINDRIDYSGMSVTRDHHRVQARLLQSSWKTPEDILTAKFPSEFPGSFVYDGLLKELQVGVLDPQHPGLTEYLAEALAHFEAAESIFEGADFDLVCLSHHSSWTYGALAWSALRRGIPVIHLYGEFGVLRFGLMTEPEDILTAQERPTPQELDGLTGARKEQLEAVGEEYITQRLNGATNDLGAKLAYLDRKERVDRERIAAEFGWDPATPIIGVFGHSWFDFPHSIGMSWFRDFVDWMHSTLDTAQDIPTVNFLCKSHPADNWYPPVQGETLADMVATRNLPNIAIVDESWNGGALLQAVDGVITCHGTIAIEAAASGVPALIAHPGWYGDLGFTVTARSLDDYRKKLKTEWWLDWKTTDAAERARLLAGCMYCAPGWQKSYALDDDHRQFDIYKDIPAFLATYRDELEIETQNLSNWWDTQHRHYHIFAMMNADSYVSVNPYN